MNILYKQTVYLEQRLSL